MTIHVTPIPRLIDLAAPAFTLGTANAAGSALTAVASDATLLVYDTTVPTTIAYSASAAAGDSSTASRRNHTHGMAASDAVAQASKAATVAETDENTYVPPDLIRFSPGVSKGWASVAGNGVDGGSYNVSSTARDGAGDYTVNWDDDFANSGYSFSLAAQNSSPRIVTMDARSADAVGVETIDSDFANIDADFSVSVFGVQ